MKKVISAVFLAALILMPHGHGQEPAPTQQTPVGEETLESAEAASPPATNAPDTANPESKPPRTLAPAPLQGMELEQVFQSVTGGTGKELSLHLGEMVRMALSNNPEIKIQRIQPELGEADIHRALGLFDPKFSFQTQYSESDTPQNAQEYIATGGQTTQSQLALIDQLVSLQNTLDDLLAQIKGTSSTTSSSSSVSKYTDPRIFSSQNFSMQWQLGGLTPLGTQYALSLNQLQARNDINHQMPPSLFYPEITSVFGLTLTQPLLKNFGPAATMAGVRIARIQKRIGWYEWQRQLNQTLSEALYRYFDLVYAFENMRVRKEAVEGARLLERQNIQRVEQGKMRPSDVWEAQTSLSNNIDVTLRAMNSYVESQNSLKLLIITDKMAAAGETGRIIPVASLDLPPIRIERSTFIGEALANRPEYLNIVSRAEQEGLRVRYARNQAYPTVDLQGSLGFTGLEGEYGSSLGNSFAGQGTAYAVGVVVSIPLGNVEGKANLDAAKLRQQQAQLAIKKAVTEISIDIDTSISLLETSRLQVQAARDTARAAANTATAEEKLLEEGKSTTFEVVRLQNNASDARSRELAALAAYRKNVVRLAVSRGILLADLGVSLETEAIKSSLPGRRKKIDLPQEGQGIPH